MVGGWTLSMANYIDNAGPGGEGARMPQTFIQGTDDAQAPVLHHQPENLQPKNQRIRPHCRPLRVMTPSTCWLRPSTG
jgi:branched-chain amino acid transport system substrate-binding protein